MKAMLKLIEFQLETNENILMNIDYFESIIYPLTFLQKLTINVKNWVQTDEISLNENHIEILFKKYLPRLCYFYCSIQSSFHNYAKIFKSLEKHWPIVFKSTSNHIYTIPWHFEHLNLSMLDENDLDSICLNVKYLIVDKQTQNLSHRWAIAYGVPFGIAALLFVILSILNRRAHAFIVENVLGIKTKKSNKNPSQKSEDDKSKPWSLKQNVDTFLYIEQDSEEEDSDENKDLEEQKGLPCIVRFFCDIFATAIITVLLEIIFEKCILANKSILAGDPCPDFAAECFGMYNGINKYGPFQCKKGDNASFPVDPPRLACYGWVYNDMTTDQVLDAIGVSGGLLGLVSCIVPLVYYVSYFRKRWWWISFFCLYPEVLSVLTIIAFSLAITMTCGGWLWALSSSCAKTEYSFKRISPSWQCTFYKAQTGKFWLILLLLLVIGGIGFVSIPKHKSNKEDANITVEKRELLQTKVSSTQKQTNSSTSISGSTTVATPGEVHQTLIIDTIFPYPTSRKPIISVNYAFPGPLLEAYEGDTFIIRVINRLKVPSTIHWHGMRQIGTQDMDGAVGLTQCAIPPNYEMIYKFKAEPAGTTWYHGHLLEQYTDGLYGPMIIRRRNESNQELYDSEHVLMIADWYNNCAHDELLPWYLNSNNPAGNEPSPDAIIVNGKFTQSLFISLSGSTHIRFRILNTASFSMHTVSIDGLPLHIIEVDSTATFPYTVNSFSINVAQRVSFYIDLSELDPSYTSKGTSSTNSLFLRIQAIISMYPVDIVNYIPPYEHQRYPYPTFFNPLYLAILSLDSTNSTPTYSASQKTPTLTNAVTPLDTNLLAARPFDQNNNGIPNATHYLNLTIVFKLGTDGINRGFINNVTYSSDANYMHMRADPKKGITSDMYSPLLHQMAEKVDHLGSSSPRKEARNQLPTIQSDENGHYFVPYQAVVDIFLNNTDAGEHPFHLHGYTFWIVATSDYPVAESLYAADYIQRDTVSVPALGWVKIRFVADNPGAWLFHCHIEWHMSAGLALAFLTSPKELLADGYRVTESQRKMCHAIRQFNAKNETKPY
ncbi:hypothetical protein I4U23_011359 [Adineta vaga]|nr:hypothetical protein I4U23_011359 [Adineta vaga]